MSISESEANIGFGRAMMPTDLLHNNFKLSDAGLITTIY